MKNQMQKKKRSKTLRIVSLGAMFIMILALSAGVLFLRPTDTPIEEAYAQTIAPLMAGSWQDAGNFDIDWPRSIPDLPGGTAANPWLIATPQHMAGMANRLNANAPAGIRTQHFRVVADINLSAHAWVPITTFSGVFDGGMHTIYVPNSIGRGLFTHVTGAAAAVRNIVLRGDAAIRTAGTTALNGGAGTLIATLNGATVENIINHVNLTITVAGNRTHVGAIIGTDAAQSPANALIRNLINFGNITLGGATTGTNPRMEAAGIMSNAWMSIRAYNLANYGNIHSTVANTLALGGLIAHLSGSGGGGVRNVTNSYNVGNISSNTLMSSAAWRNVGGIMGGWTPNTNNSAGFVADNVYNLGNVTGPAGRAIQLFRVEGTTGTGGRNVRNTFSTATTIAGKNTGSAVTRTGRHGTINTNGQVLGWVSGTNPAPYGVPVPLNLTAQMQNIQRSFTGAADIQHSARWIPSVENPNIPVLEIDNMRLNLASDLFRVSANPVSLRMNHGNNTIPALSSEHLEYLNYRQIRLVGWATTRQRADLGIVDFAPGAAIAIPAHDYQFNRLFAVYEFTVDRTLVVQRGDGILTLMNAQSAFTSHIRRPGQFIAAPDGRPNASPYFAPFLRLNSAVAEHIGWADSLSEARLGQVNPNWPISPMHQPRLFEDTRIYAVWRRNDEARLELRFSFESLPSPGTMTEAWFNETFPTIVQTFSAAQQIFTLTGFAPTTTVPYHAFVGWATSLERARAGTIDHAYNATITVPYPHNLGVIPLYAVFEPIRLTLFVNSVFNTGISPTPQFSFASATNQSVADIQVTSGGNNITLTTTAMTQVVHGGAVFVFLGWSRTLQGAINGSVPLVGAAYVDFLGAVSNPTSLNVYRNVELHAVWEVLEGRPLPPIEGMPPILPPVEGMNRLPAPQNVEINVDSNDDYILSWDYVDNAMGFRVYINGHPTIFFPNVPYAITSINLSIFHFPLPPGETSFNFHIQIRAIGNNVNYTHSLLSSITVFNVSDCNYNPGGVEIPNVDDDEDLFDDDWDDEQGETQLGTPINLQINNGILTWTGVANSRGYRIYADGVFIVLVETGTSVDLMNLGLAVGEHSITVRANGSNNFITSNHSVPREFVIDASLVSWTFIWTTNQGGFSGSGGAGNVLPGDQPSEPIRPNNPPLIEAGGSWTWDGWEIDEDNRRFTGSFTWIPPQPTDTEAVQLSAPNNIRIYITNSHVLLWDYVDNAHMYRIYINGVLWYTTSNTAVFLKNFPEGDFDIQIRAMAPLGDEFLDSYLSDALIIRVYIDGEDDKEILIVGEDDATVTTTPPDLPEYIELPSETTTPPPPPAPPLTHPVRLMTPSNVRVNTSDDDYVLLWDAVANAHSYRIYINNEFWYATSNTAVILRNFPAGDFAFRIRAIAQAGTRFLDSELSASLNINVSYNDEYDKEIAVTDPNSPEQRILPPPLCPNVNLPPNITTPQPPVATIGGGWTFSEFMRDLWYWFAIGLVFLLMLTLILVFIAKRGSDKTKILVTNQGETINVFEETDPKANANACIADCRAKLQYAITLVTAHDVSPQNTEIERCAKAALESAAQALEKAVGAVAEYKKKCGK